MQDNNQQQLIKDMQQLEAKIQMLLSHYLNLQQAHQTLQNQYHNLLEQQKTAVCRLAQVSEQLERLIEAQSND